jgi:hypothetical protein
MARSYLRSINEAITLNECILVSPTDLAVRGGTNVQNTKICSYFFVTRCRSFDRRQYSGPLLLDMGITPLLIIWEPVY